MKRFAFQWRGGGYNEVLANSLEEAMEKAAEMGLDRDYRSTPLYPNYATFVVLKSGERNPYYMFWD